MATNDNERVIRGSGDFLKDMGYDNPDEMRLKFALANSIALTIEDLGVKQVEAAKLTGLAQSDISRIVNGIVKDVAVFRLMSVRGEQRIAADDEPFARIVERGDLRQIAIVE
jgi:predicted XRE-type DNA-binding protein